MNRARILVVEDDPGQNRMYKKALIRAGYEVEGALSAEEARRLLADGRYDLILLDMVLETDQSGLNLLKFLKADSELRPIPVVTMSGHGPDYEGLTRSLELGAADCVNKPVELAVLAAKIKKLLAEARVSTAPRGNSGNGSGKPKARVLVVEDEPEYSNLLQRVLVNAGYRCTAAETLSEAREELSRFSPDLIILDQQLTDGAGSALCERIRANPACARVLVAFLTGDKSFAAGNAWLTAGGDTCWLKPTGPSRIEALVKGLLRRHDWDGEARKLIGPGLFIDRRERVVIFNGRRSKKLTDRDLRFIETLGAAGNALLHRQVALDVVFGHDGPGSPELAMNEMLRRLRTKLPRALAKAIETVFGKGYRLRLPTPDGDVNQPRIART